VRRGTADRTSLTITPVLYLTEGVYRKQIRLTFQAGAVAMDLIF
jgi:hypothetical protein